MSRERSGSVEYHRPKSGAPHFRIRITLNDGNRSPYINLAPTSDSPNYREWAEDKARRWAKRAKEENLTLEDFGVVRSRDEHGGETVTEWFTRWEADRRKRGIGSALRDDRSRYTRWVLPVIGNRSIATLTREDVERVRDHLDAAIAKQRDKGKGYGGCSPKTALAAWTVLTSMMRDATAAKDRTLRVRTTNPCADVLPPERGVGRQKTFIYPIEFAALVAHAEIPREWRELYALASYLYLRPGELRAVRWSDVDLAAGVVHVTKAWDERAQKEKPPKTRNGIRDVPIELALRPLLKRMKRGQPISAFVVPLLSRENEDDIAPMFRVHLERAKVTRPRLTEDTPTTMPVNFRSLRDSGITWLALAGVPLARMQRRAGHDSPATTLGYVKMAEDLSGAVGAPFGPLPADLVGDAGPESPNESPAAPPVADLGGASGALARDDSPRSAPIGSGNAHSSPALRTHSVRAQAGS